MPFLGVIKPAFKQTLNSYPFVLKNVSLYFAGYFFLFAGIYLLALSRFSYTSLSPGLQLGLLVIVPMIFAHIFLVFMIPYYAFRHNKASAPPFWQFIADKVWPLVLNQIKALFVILFFLLLLLVPGIYKAIRLFFLTETVFFDKQKMGTLKKASRSSKGFFWLSVFVIVFILVINSLYSFAALPLLEKQLLSPFWLSVFFMPVLILCFYVKSFGILFKAQVYFQIKKAKNEEISL